MPPFTKARIEIVNVPSHFIGEMNEANITSNEANILNSPQIVPPRNMITTKNQNLLKPKNQISKCPRPQLTIAIAIKQIGKKIRKRRIFTIGLSILICI